MKTNGVAEVREHIINSPLKSYVTLEVLEAQMTRVHALGVVGNTIYFRISPTVVIPLIDYNSLILILNNYLSDEGIIENIVNTIIDSIVNNLEQGDVFVQAIANSTVFVQTLFSNIEFLRHLIDSIFLYTNVEVQSLQGVYLFRAFDPTEFVELVPIVPTDPPDPSPTCVVGSSISIVGNLNPIENTIETYTIETTGGENQSYFWTVLGSNTTGGEIIGSNTGQSVLIQWKNTSNRAIKLTASAGCASYNELNDIKYISIKSYENPTEIAGFPKNLSFGSTIEQAATKAVDGDTILVYAEAEGLQIGINLYEDTPINNNPLVVSGYYAEKQPFSNTATVYEVNIGYIRSITTFSVG